MRVKISSFFFINSVFGNTINTKTCVTTLGCETKMEYKNVKTSMFFAHLYHQVFEKHDAKLGKTPRFIDKT